MVIERKEHHQTKQCQNRLQKHHKMLMEEIDQDIRKGKDTSENLKLQNSQLMVSLEQKKVINREIINNLEYRKHLTTETTKNRDGKNEVSRGST